MEVEWLRTAVRGLAAVCLIASIVECAVEDGESAGGFRLVCGAAVAAAIVRMAVDAVQRLF